MHLRRFALILLSTLHHLHLSTCEGFIDCKTACKECQIGNDSLELIEIYCSMCKECRESRRGGKTIKYTKGKTKKIARTEKPKKTTAKTTTKTTTKATTKTTTTTTRPKTTKPTTKTTVLITKLTTKPTTRTTTYTTKHFMDTTVMEKQHLPRAKKNEQDYDAHEIENWPENCPKPPICSDEDHKQSQQPDAHQCPPVPTCKPKKTTLPQCMPCYPMPMCQMPYCNQPASHPASSEYIKESDQDDYEDEKTPRTEPIPESIDYTPSHQEEMVRTGPRGPLLHERGGFGFQNNIKLNRDYDYMYLGVPKTILGVDQGPKMI